MGSRVRHLLARPSQPTAWPEMRYLFLANLSIWAPSFFTVDPVCSWNSQKYNNICIYTLPARPLQARGPAPNGADSLSMPPSVCYMGKWVAVAPGGNFTAHHQDCVSSQLGGRVTIIHFVILSKLCKVGWTPPLPRQTVSHS